MGGLNTDIKEEDFDAAYDTKILLEAIKMQNRIVKYIDEDILNMLASRGLIWTTKPAPEEISDFFVTNSGNAVLGEINKVLKDANYEPYPTTE